MSWLAGTWSAALEALEADVEALDRALQNGAPVALSSWQPPQDLGPVPQELLPRAERLVERIADVRGRGRQRLGELQGELDQVGRRRDASAAYSASGGAAKAN